MVKSKHLSQCQEEIIYMYLCIWPWNWSTLAYEQ